MATEKYFHLVKEFLGSCKNCGSDSMIVEGRFTSTFFAEPKPEKQGEANIDFSGIFQVTAICQNCGYIHSFNKGVLDKKLVSE